MQSQYMRNQGRFNVISVTAIILTLMANIQSLEMVNCGAADVTAKYENFVEDTNKCLDGLPHLNLSVSFKDVVNVNTSGFEWNKAPLQISQAHVCGENTFTQFLNTLSDDDSRALATELYSLWENALVLYAKNINTNHTQINMNANTATSSSSINADVEDSTVQSTLTSNDEFVHHSASDWTPIVESTINKLFS